MNNKNFILGCNYWASNAGTEMWKQWCPEAVEKDLITLNENGIRYLRVFPLWRDFQPVKAYYQFRNIKKEYVMTDDSLPQNSYFLDETMLGRFEAFCDLCKKYDMKLIVGLLTGWMSGRCFTPPVVEGLNLFTDKTALYMEEKFIKGFVSRFKDEEVIYAWDLGNECNCMSESDNAETSAVWTAFVANAIKANDTRHRPVISGMHGLSVNNEWRIQDQAESCDILTTHPYPQFVPLCFEDDFLSFRTLNHATSESRYYSTISGKDCLVEEIGTLGPCYCDDETAAAFLRTNLYSNWANGSPGVMWWCACEQVNLKSAPYTWAMLERELGLMYADGAPKPTLKEFKRFSQWLEGFGKQLPKAHTDGVCIITDCEPWGNAYMAHCLAKQAGATFTYAYSGNRLPESDLYILPCADGDQSIRKEYFDELKKRVYDGAVLYVSNGGMAVFAEFEKFFGVHICNTTKTTETLNMEFNGENIEFTRNRRMIIKQSGCEVLACDSLGMPAFTRFAYGKGTVYYLNFPLVTMLIDKSNAFSQNHYTIYKEIFKQKLKQHPINVDNPYVGVTLHYGDEECTAVMINYSGEEQNTQATIAEGYEITSVYGGERSKIKANEAVVVTLKKI